jgi:hypothetical protein
MTSTAPPVEQLPLLANLDDIRLAIDRADERARLLRRLLRLALKLHLHLTTADRLTPPPKVVLHG